MLETSLERNGGNVLARVDNINQLQGWRKANEDELKVIQGILLKGASIEKGSGNVINVVLSLFALACLVGVKEFVGYIFVALSNGKSNDIPVFVIIIVVLILIALGLVILIFRNLKKNTAKTYYDAINTNQLQVLDIKMEEIISLRGVGRGTDGHRVKVSDMYGTYCEENIVFECCNGYQKTKGILIDVTMSQGEKGIVSRKCVIPCKEKDPRLWHIGMKNYSTLAK